jgi:predicted DNA-binding transcriptional regulator AlpA
MTRKREVKRPYPPALVSAETLAYLLDCSRSTIDDYVARGILPKPITIGYLHRWWWDEVQTIIKAQNELANSPSTQSPSLEDPFLEGLKNVAASHA